MNKPIRYIYHIVYKLIHQLIYFSNTFFLYIVPNFKVIICKRLKFTKIPTVQQLVKCSGKGKIFIGKNCSFGYKLGGFHKYGYIELQPRYKNAEICIGDNVATNNNIFICAANRIEIGDDTLIGQYVTIMDFEAHGTNPLKRREIGTIGKVTIGKNVWIGNNVTILKNSKIGNNNIIAAGTLVSGVFPENVIVGGVPDVGRALRSVQEVRWILWRQGVLFH